MVWKHGAQTWKRQFKMEIFIDQFKVWRKWEFPNKPKLVVYHHCNQEQTALNFILQWGENQRRGHVLLFGFAEELFVGSCDISEGSKSSPHAEPDYFQIMLFPQPNPLAVAMSWLLQMKYKNNLQKLSKLDNIQGSFRHLQHQDM